MEFKLEVPFAIVILAIIWKVEKVICLFSSHVGATSFYHFYTLFSVMLGLDDRRRELGSECSSVF